MTTPGRGRFDTRVFDLERHESAGDQGRLPPVAREPGGLFGRDGKARGKLLGTLTKGATVECAIFLWTGERYRDSLVRVQVQCFFLNEADEFQSGTKVKIEFFCDNVWEVVNAWCEIDDTDYGEETTPSIGESLQAAEVAAVIGPAAQPGLAAAVMPGGIVGPVLVS